MMWDTMAFNTARLRWMTAALIAFMATVVTYAKQDRVPVGAIADRRLEVTTPRGNGVLPLYVSRDWNKPQPEVKHALIIFHGAARNAVDYNHSGETAIATAGMAWRGATRISLPREAASGRDEAEAVVWAGR